MIKKSPYLSFRYKNSNKVLNILKKMFFYCFFQAFGDGRNNYLRDILNNLEDFFQELTQKIPESQHHRAPRAQ